MRIPRPIAILLWPASRIYGKIVAWRSARYEKGSVKARRLKATVVSVGNITVGGTGKTPMVLWLAEKFLAEGKKVGILSRGYRGSKGTSDEVELLKSRLGGRVTFGVGTNRYEVGRRLEAEDQIDIFVLDDGFQHRQLARDLDLVMLDGSRKLQNEWLLPAGMLREPLAAIRRADILIVTRKFERPPVEAKDAHQFSIFYSQTRLLGFRRLGTPEGPLYLSEIGPGPFFAFCGIGNPEGFFADLDRWHVTTTGRRSFADHHKYSRGDVTALEKRAQEVHAAALITTEKDAQNIPASSFCMPVWVSVIDLTFTAESELLAAIDRILDARRGAAA